ncbi:MAG: 30S ribosomal protein S7 [Ignavibacteria bacterium]|nr:30S ribosomal protein S7 [Ignavibacteria bacterium]
MRKRRAEKRILPPDPIYNEVLVTKLINYVMKRGKKNVARKLVYGAFDIIKERTNKNPLEVFLKAVNNVKPMIEVRSRRIGGATYQVPTEVRPERQIALALRWIINFARERKDKSFANKLAAELIAAANNEGAAIKKKEDTHRMAEANKAFAHFKW